MEPGTSRPLAGLVPGFTPSKIVVAGDWHGNGSWAYGVIRRLPGLLPDETPRIVVHCGDFGVWPGAAGERYLDRLDTQLDQAGGVLWFVDGNHEWHPGLARIPVTGGVRMVRERIWHLPRGSRWVWHGRRWLALGGAVSVDRALRTEGLTWWPGEEITVQEAAVAVSAGPADVMVCHDAPAGVPLHLPPPQPAWAWAPADLARSDDHRILLRGVVDQVRPRWLMHGHYHPGFGHQTVTMGHGPVEVTRFDGDGSGGNWAVLDVAAMGWGGFGGR